MITQIDFHILDLIQSIRTPFLDFIIPYITYLGSGGIVWLVISGVMLVFKKTRKTAMTLLLSLLLGFILSTLGLKNIVCRPRPFNAPGAPFGANRLLISIPAGKFSFPSGHSVSSFAAATVLMIYDRRIGVPALVLAALIAFTRLYLYVHFPTDVLAGALLGVLFAVLAYKIVNLIRRKQNEKKLSDNT